MNASQVQRPAFGTVLVDHMATAQFRDGQWGAPELKPVWPI
jgi:hypothetical protein